MLEDIQPIIEFLAKLKGISPEEVIKEAVFQLYNREMERLPKLKIGDDGTIYVNGKPLVKCSDNVLTHFPEEILLKLDYGTAELDEVLLYLLLFAAGLKEGFEFYPETFREEFGFLPFGDE